MVGEHQRKLKSVTSSGLALVTTIASPEKKVSTFLVGIVHNLAHPGKPPLGPALAPMRRFGVHRGTTATFPRFGCEIHAQL